MTRAIAAASCVLAAFAGWGQQAGSGWPQFLGPSRDGRAAASIPSSARLQVAWRMPVMSGHSGISASADRLFTLGSDGEKDFLLALDAASGRERWRAELSASVGGLEPSSTPAIAHGLVIAVDSACNVVAADVDSGRIVWRRSLAADYKSRFAAAGCAMSPLVSGNRVLLPTGAREGTRLVSFDAATGATQWTADKLLNSLNGASGFASIDGVPVVLYHSGKPPGIGGVSAVSPETGAELWHVDLTEGISDTTPVLTSHGVLMQTWSGSAMLEGATRDAAPRVRWTTKDLTAGWTPAVVHEGHVYGFGGNSGEFFMCVDAATGVTKWSERIYRGQVINAGGTLVVSSESSGLLRLVTADPNRYRELQRIQVLTAGARTRTAPSIAAGMIFIRNLEEVVAVRAR